jgi:phosphatidylethanolamine-binding protein (PEBP) family uncharacterized protein
MKANPTRFLSWMLAAGALMLAAGTTAAKAGAPAFTLTSPDLAGGVFTDKFVLNGFGCTGQNVSPALTWSNAPSGTKSFALQVHDPDAPTGSGLWHWGRLQHSRECDRARTRSRKQRGVAARRRVRRQHRFPRHRRDWR